MQEIKFYISKKRHLEYLTYYSFIWLSLLCLMIMGIHVTIVPRFNVYLLPLGIIGATGSTILLFHFIHLIIQLFKKEPIIVLGANGLLINSYGTYSILWPEIKSVDLLKARGRNRFTKGDCLRITFNQPGAFLLKLNFIQRIYVKIKFILGYSYHLEIKVNSLDNFAEDIIEMIQIRLHGVNGNEDNRNIENLRTPEWLKRLDERWNPQ